MRRMAGWTLVVAALAATTMAATTMAATPMPPVKTRLPGVEFNYGVKKFDWEGVSVVPDPVNHETLYLCGRNGGAPFGSIGSWALAEDGKTWRQMTFTSAVLDPLRAQCLAARQPAKDGEAAARNVFYAGLDATKEAAAVKGEAAKRIGESLRLTEALAGALGKTNAAGPLAPCIARAAPLVEKASANLKTAHAGFDAGRLDAALLKACFDAQWALDEAAACLANAPGPRENAAAAYDEANTCVVLFGGNHGDYLMSDTWVYDCTAQAWRQVWPKTAPAPRCAASLKWDADRKQLVLTGGRTVRRTFDYYKHYEDLPKDEWTFDAKTGEWAGTSEGVAAGTRTYRSIVACWNPCWYDGAPRGDAKATADWLDRLTPNVWTHVPPVERPAAERDWGTARLDTDRDQIYHWTGGHCADHGDQVSTYHPAINRWSIPYIPAILGKGMSFDGRPDCLNHTYLNYAYDPLSKRLICTSMGGTGVYNPDRRDVDCSVDQPFNRHIYLTCTVGTPHGVVVWSQGYVGLFDAKALAWNPLPTTGKVPANKTDGSAVAYDSKRDCLWMMSLAGYNKPIADVWQYDLTTGKVTAMGPAGLKAIGGTIKTMREAVYLPKADLVLLNNFVAGKMVAYDPEQNRLVLLAIDKSAEKRGSNLGGVSMGMAYDPARDLVWGVGNYKNTYVLKVDAATALPGPAADAPGGNPPGE